MITNKDTIKAYQTNVKFVNKYFPKKIIDLFPADFLYNLEILDKSKLSGYDYIDALKPEDLSSSIMIGVDPSKRPFISFSLTFEELSGKSKDEVVTIFQNDINNPDLWLSTGVNKFLSARFVLSKEYNDITGIGVNPCGDKIKQLIAHGKDSKNNKPVDVYHVSQDCRKKKGIIKIKDYNSIKPKIPLKDLNESLIVAYNLFKNKTSTSFKLPENNEDSKNNKSSIRKNFKS